MWAAEQLDLARDIGERGVDLRVVRNRPRPVDCERADLQKVELPSSPTANSTSIASHASRVSSSRTRAMTGASDGGQPSGRDLRQRKVLRLSPAPAVTRSVRPERSS
jgi:hypothetical protein